jgi:protoporphyrinogen oxidase
MSEKQIIEKIQFGLKKLNFIKNNKDVNFFSIKKFEYAYVIYDLNHRKNVDLLKNMYARKNIDLIGRWGSWEYLNSDQVINQSKILSKKFLS